jgi:hypothetical protein
MPRPTGTVVVHAQSSFPEAALRVRLWVQITASPRGAYRGRPSVEVCPRFLQFNNRVHLGSCQAISARLILPPSV